MLPEGVAPPAPELFRERRGDPLRGAVELGAPAPHQLLELRLRKRCELLRVRAQLAAHAGRRDHLRVMTVLDSGTLCRDSGSLCRARPATIELASPWRPAKAPEYVASFGDFAPDFGVEPDERWKQLGEHRTDAILEVETEVETRCDPDTCRTCVTAISARIGFTPSEIRLHEELRRNRCARKLTMLHERQHEAVTREAQAIAVREAKRNLRWARYPHAAHVTRASGREAGQEEIMRKVGDDLTRALEKAMAYEEAENSRLDRPERYRRESRRQWRICGSR